LLPAKLKAFAAAGIENDNAILVLVDADNDNCVNLKRSLVQLANSLNPRPNVVFRIAVEESEAFYLGDLHALKLAFPHADMALARSYVQDSVCGTAEMFGRVVGDNRFDKVSWAEKIGPRMAIDPKKNRSPSFRALHEGIRKLITPPVPVPKKPKRKFRHAPRTSPSRRER